MTNFDKFTSKIKNTGKKSDRIKSFSYSDAGVFCLSWEKKGQRQSIWISEFCKMLKLYLNFDEEKELYFFPANGGEVVKLFGGELC